ncbi:MAG: APC family permease [Hyphomicrobiaceae bacterium]
MTTAIQSDAGAAGSGRLVRAIDWRGAFWVASGVPALVLFSIGGIASTAGYAAFAVWGVSMLMGFVQSFTYAEIAGLYPNKSGGASVYGATAWLRYGKLLAPLSVWCNWIAWTPVLSLGCSIAAGYILNAIAPVPTFTEASPEVIAWLGDPAHAGQSAADAIAAVTAAATPAIQTWSLISFDLPWLPAISLNSTFFIGAILMLIVFAIQHRGILGTANTQKWIGLLVIIPMLIVGIVPLFNGSFDSANFSPFVPGTTAEATWNNGGWTLFLGGLFIAAWSTYAFETAICYTSEFRNPGTDTFKAIFYAGLLCLVLYTLVPFTFQGALGVSGMTDPGVVAGTGVADAMANMVAGGNILLKRIFVVLMILALILAIMTAMAGSSRTLYQGSVDGWLPRYLSHVNSHGAPTRAMWTDLVTNLILLSFVSSDVAMYYTVLAISNCGYIIFNFLNLNAGWMHRMDSPHIKRPWRAPTILIGFNTILAFVNAALMGAGAKVWGSTALLWYGLATAAAIIPVFWYRHYVQDGGRFPDHMLADLGLEGQDLGERRAGILPYVALVLGLVVVLVANHLFQMPA